MDNLTLAIEILTRCETEKKRLEEYEKEYADVEKAGEGFTWKKWNEVYNNILHNGNKMIVKWNEPCGRWDLYIVNVSHIPMGAWRPLVIDWRTSDWKEYSDCHECEVIDNIFDNPELLGGAE